MDIRFAGEGLKRALASGALATVALLALGQDDAGTSPNSEQGATPSFLDTLINSHWPMDLYRISWLAATLAIAYAISTFVFVGLLNGRSPNLAARYALLWGGLVFVLIHVFA